MRMTILAPRLRLRLSLAVKQMAQAIVDEVRTLHPTKKTKRVKKTTPSTVSANELLSAR
jgi:hypothetical protein